MKIAIILGTRPEIIKMAPVIKQLKNKRIKYFILHTGQHYSFNLNKVFFKDLRIPYPKYDLKVGSGSHAEETGKILIGVEKIIVHENPDLILVEGDTNSVLAGALAAVKTKCKIGHIESGLRSYDRRMPEEVNRVLVDHMADYLFAPTEKSKSILLNEGIPKQKIFVTGNTIVDVIFHYRKIAERKSKILKELSLESNHYFLVTVHRQENVDNKIRLKNILEGLHLVHMKFKIPLIYPIHPRTRKKIAEFSLKTPCGVYLIEPIGYFNFLKLETNATLILTDSGGIQEEACILKVPCVTLRDNTERPETLEVGGNILTGTDPWRILNGVSLMMSKKRNWINPFGDGNAAMKIVQIIKNHIFMQM